MRKFVIGDIHGANKALLQVLEHSGFNKDKDKLICLGDVADSWPEVPEAFETLLSIPNLLYLIGNHDAWLIDYLKMGYTPRIWTSQGGRATIDAYSRLADHEMEKRHLKFLEESPYYIEEDDNLFVHGGFATAWPIKNQAPYDLMWDRNLWWHAKFQHAAENYKVAEKYDKVFIGHTTTSRDRKDLTPVRASNVWNLDQGAGWEGKLTLMDIETEEYWQSDLVKDLYPNAKGR